MACHIAILEDDAGLQAAMADCLQDRFPQYPARFFATAGEMIWHLRRHLPEVLAIGLDHDLELVPVVNNSVLNSGTGRDVADYLASEVPVCPVVIHTTNDAAAIGMERVLQETGWATSRVVPYCDLEWVSEVWLRAMRDAIVGAVGASPARIVPSPGRIVPRAVG